MNTIEIKNILITYKNTGLSLEYFIRKGSKETILILHGLGGAKDNFWTSTQFEQLKEYTIICFDNPGTGNSCYPEDSLLDVDDLSEITNLFIEALKIDHFHLVGASMGGLVALLYLRKANCRTILSFTNIEGNLLPEDCMFSSKVITFTYQEFVDKGYYDGIANMRKNSNPGYRIIANNLQMNTNIRAYFNYSFKTVQYSNDGSLLREFIALPMRKLFIYGEENNTLSYLPDLRKINIEMAEIPESNHFAFYDNPAIMYSAIASFFQKVR